MPTIDVTMGDGATVDATMAGEAIAVEVNGAGYTDRQAVAALDGETVTPGQVGTASDPVTEEHVESSHAQELSVSDVLGAPSYPTQADLPADRSTGFIALIEDENRIYFEEA